MTLSMGTVRWVQWVRYGGVRYGGTVGTVGTVQRVQWVRYGGYGTVGTVRWVRYGACRYAPTFFFRPTPDGSRQVVYQAGKTIALCKFTELKQQQHWS